MAKGQVCTTEQLRLSAGHLIASISEAGPQDLKRKSNKYMERLRMAGKRLSETIQFLVTACYLAEVLHPDIIQSNADN